MDTKAALEALAKTVANNQKTTEIMLVMAGASSLLMGVTLIRQARMLKAVAKRNNDLTDIFDDLARKFQEDSPESE